MSVESLLALVTLTAMEIVLGIDNIVFLAIVTSRLPEEQRPRARKLGLSLAMGMRVLLLMGAKSLTSLTTPLFTLIGHGFTGKDLVMLGGGLFLITKSTHEIHKKIELQEESHGSIPKVGLTMRSAIIQIILLDLVFSLDSVITAVGMAQHIEIMVIAVVIAIALMMVYAGSISDFVERHPTFKMLALAFLLLIGVMLLVEGWGGHVSKGYIYFAMGFSLGVEMLNFVARKKHKRTADVAKA